MNHALTESNTRVTAILESITDGFMHLDIEWRYLYINTRMEEMIGRKREELIGKRIWDMVPELIGTPFEHNYRKAMATQQAVHFEGRHPTFQRWLDIHVYPIKDGLSIYLHDITERKLAEESLRESELRFRQLVDSNMIGIVVCNLDGDI